MHIVSMPFFAMLVNLNEIWLVYEDLPNIVAAHFDSIPCRAMPCSLHKPLERDLTKP
jgi:hypothetical protein